MKRIWPGRSALAALRRAAARFFAPARGKIMPDRCAARCAPAAVTVSRRRTLAETLAATVQSIHRRLGPRLGAPEQAAARVSTRGWWKVSDAGLVESFPRRVSTRGWWFPLETRQGSSSPWLTALPPHAGPTPGAVGSNTGPSCGALTYAGCRFASTRSTSSSPCAPQASSSASSLARCARGVGALVCARVRAFQGVPSFACARSCLRGGPVGPFSSPNKRIRRASLNSVNSSAGRTRLDPC